MRIMTNDVTDPVAALEDEHRWLAPARISVTGPAGWYPTEQVTVSHDSGDAVVRVESWPVGPDVTVAEFADAHVDTLTGLTDWRDFGARPGPVLGTDGLVRSARWQDGTVVDGRFGYAIVHARAYVVTSTVRGGNERLRTQAGSIVDAVAIASTTDVDEARLPLRPAGADFAPVEAAWRIPAGEPSDLAAERHVITHDEALGAARHFGVATFPGADHRVHDGLAEAGRLVATAVAWRSLRVRGAEAGGALAEALELACAHDLFVRVTPDEGPEQWYACRPDRMVRVVVTDDGDLALTVLDTADLAALVPVGVAVTGTSAFLRDGVVAGHEVTWSGRDTVADALAALLPH